MLFSEDEVRRRRREIAASPDLQPLAHRLRSLLKPVLDNSIPRIPGKARLTRHGGVCPDDRTRLAFDPLSPHVHRCPQCGTEVRGDRHDANWRWWYHLWLSERVLHLGVLGTLLDDPLLTRRGIELVTAYATMYPTVPNQDNVLGPTRLFFSTYLESIWLTQMALAIGFLARPGEWADSVRAMVRQSADLIRAFGEGWSNRQVWHNTAMMAAGTVLDDAELFAHGLSGPYGVRAQLARAVTSDGLWFEGENYHFFALRGFQLAAEIARGQGLDLYTDPGTSRSLADMHTAPIRTLYPDLTMPARGDSPFGVSVVQPRFAELWEVGLVRTNASVVENLLVDLYEADVPEAQDPGLVEISEHEVHRPASKLRRDRLGWRALLWMRPDVAPTKRRPVRDVTVFDHAGVVVVRPDAGTYLSIDVGGRRGGHGHPDLLQVNIFLASPVVLDPGTASYVDESLHWYRSPLAHNGPMLALDGSTVLQGWCTAVDVNDGWGWCRSTAGRTLASDPVFTRTLIAGAPFVLDVVDTHVGEDVEVTLPIHLYGNGRASDDLTEIRADQGLGRVTIVPRPGEKRSIEKGLGVPSLHFAPGPPIDYVVRRATGPGRWIQLYSTTATALEVVDLEEGSIRVLCDGQVYRLQWSDTRAMVRAPDSPEVVLEGRQAASPKAAVADPPVPERRRISIPRLDRSLHPRTWTDDFPLQFVHDLGADHYRRSEDAYVAGQSIRARVGIGVRHATVEFAVRVWKRDVTFRTAGDVDPGLDNEIPDIHSDGVQCYVGSDGWIGVLVIPDPESDRVRCIVGSGTAGDVDVTGSWAATSGGYSMIVRLTLPQPVAKGETVLVNLAVNEMYPQRERRAGQLVLSGGGGWVYLRGDRESPGQALVAEVV